MILVVLENGGPRMIKLSYSDNELVEKEESFGEFSELFYYFSDKYGFDHHMDWMLYDDDDIDLRIEDGNKVEFESFASYCDDGDDEVGLWEDDDDIEDKWKKIISGNI